MSEVREMTVKEMLGLLEWHEQMGRGDYVVKADATVLIDDTYFMVKLG